MTLSRRPGPGPPAAAAEDSAGSRAPRQLGAEVGGARAALPAPRRRLGQTYSEGSRSPAWLARCTEGSGFAWLLLGMPAKADRWPTHDLHRSNTTGINDQILQKVHMGQASLHTYHLHLYDVCLLQH